jgi:indoleamine 2,3-dioxygenase
LLGHEKIVAMNGFLPNAEPLPRLPQAFDAWEQAAAALPKLFVAQRIRRAVAQLPPFPMHALHTEREAWRALVVLSFMANAYVWGQQPPAQTLPAVVAVPWCAVAKKLGLPPMLVYATHALNNWQRLDPHGPIALGNITLTQTFGGGGLDEEWFTLVHVNIEAEAARGVGAILPLVDAARRADETAVDANLDEIAATLQTINALVDRMYERCDPYIYYHRVRPFIFGWKNNPELPNGLVYEGVPEFGGRPAQFYGETGAQSCIVPAFDAALGIAHEFDDMRAYLLAMRDYVPPAHRQFIEQVERESGVRPFVQQQNKPALRESYNHCIDLLDIFRSKHLKLAADYIAKQSPAATLGTGGTSFMTYLGKHRTETRAHRL